MTLNTSLFGKFSAAIRAGQAPDDARLQLGASDPLAVYYAPFEAVNLRAKQVGAFSGPMQTNLVGMLDHIGLARWLRFGSARTSHGF